jgi:predicted N-acetyltransferase YhbS
MVAELSVRPAAEPDLDRLIDLFRQLGYAGSAPGLDQRLAGTLADPLGWVLLAERDGRVVGAVVLALVPVLHEPGPWCRMTALVVDESERGGGAGRALVASAEHHARAAGCTRIEATSASDRTGAHGFYAACGYEQASRHFLKRL